MSGLMNTSLFRRLYGRVSHNPHTNCWEYQGERVGGGYGRLGLSGKPRKRILAHRAAWELAHGPIPKDMSVCHSCDNPACVNVAHLWLGTHTENMRDCKQKGRRPKGEAHNKTTPNKTLCAEYVRAIRRDPRTHAEIADDYGCTESNISCIMRRITWAWVDDTPL